MSHSNILDIHPIVQDNDVDANFHECFLIITIKSHVLEATDKINRVFPMNLVCVVELSCSNLILMLEVFYRIYLPSLTRLVWHVKEID